MFGSMECVGVCLCGCGHECGCGHSCGCGRGDGVATVRVWKTVIHFELFSQGIKDSNSAALVDGVCTSVCLYVFVCVQVCMYPFISR